MQLYISLEFIQHYQYAFSLGTVLFTLYIFSVFNLPAENEFHVILQSFGENENKGWLRFVHVRFLFVR
jgi:hypothetical protein